MYSMNPEYLFQFYIYLTLRTEKNRYRILI